MDFGSNGYTVAFFSWVAGCFFSKEGHLGFAAYNIKNKGQILHIKKFLGTIVMDKNIYEWIITIVNKKVKFDFTS